MERQFVLLATGHVLDPQFHNFSKKINKTNARLKYKDFDSNSFSVCRIMMYATDHNNKTLLEDCESVYQQILKEAATCESIYYAFGTRSDESSFITNKKDPNLLKCFCLLMKDRYTKGYIVLQPQTNRACITTENVYGQHFSYETLQAHMQTMINMSFVTQIARLEQSLVGAVVGTTLSHACLRITLSHACLRTTLSHACLRITLSHSSWTWTGEIQMQTFFKVSIISRNVFYHISARTLQASVLWGSATRQRQTMESTIPTKFRIPNVWWDIGISRALGEHQKVSLLQKNAPGCKIMTSEYGSTVIEKEVDPGTFTFYRMYWKNLDSDGGPIPSQGPLEADMDIRWNIEGRDIEQLGQNVESMVLHIRDKLRSMAHDLHQKGIVLKMFERVRMYPMFIKVLEFVFVTNEHGKCFIVTLNHGVDPEMHDRDAMQQAEVDEHESNASTDHEGSSDGYFSEETDYGDQSRVYEFQNHSDLKAYIHIQISPKGTTSSLSNFFERYFGEKDNPGENLTWVSKQMVPEEGFQLLDEDFRKIISELTKVELTSRQSSFSSVCKMCHKFILQ